MSSIIERDTHNYAWKGSDHFHLGKYGIVGHVHFITSVAISNNNKRVCTLAKTVNLVRTCVRAQYMSRINEIRVALPPRDMILWNEQTVEGLGCSNDGRNTLEDTELISIFLRKVLQNRSFQNTNGVQRLLIDVHAHLLCDRRCDIVPFVVLYQVG